MLSAVICISDPLREEAKDVFSALRRLGVKKTVMLTGDSPRTAAAIAAQLGVDDFRAGVLPADKAEYVAAPVSYTHLVYRPLAQIPFDWDGLLAKAIPELGQHFTTAHGNQMCIRDRRCAVGKLFRAVESQGYCSLISRLLYAERQGDRPPSIVKKMCIRDRATSVRTG